MKNKNYMFRPDILAIIRFVVFTGRKNNIQLGLWMLRSHHRTGYYMAITKPLWYVWTRLSEVLLWKVCQVGAEGATRTCTWRVVLAVGRRKESKGSPPYAILTSGMSGLACQYVRPKHVVFVFHCYALGNIFIYIPPSCVLTKLYPYLLLYTQRRCLN
jgi:hypothetical protein